MLDRLISLLDALPLWALWLASVIFLLYVVAPLVVWQLQRFSAEHTLEVIDPEELPRAIDRYFLQMTPGMVAQGFVVVAYLRDAKMLAGWAAYMTLWVNRPCGQAAMVGTIISAAGITPKAKWMEFQTELADGWRVETTNSGNLGMFVQDKKNHRLQFPGIEDPAVLYHLHLWHEEQQLDPRKPRFFPADEVVVDYMTTENRRTFERQAAAGRMKMVDGKYRHTLGNAFRCTWMQCPPILQFRKARVRMAASRLKQQALSRGPMRPLPVITTDVKLVESSE
jgi:hypothetical protein